MVKKITAFVFLLGFLLCVACTPTQSGSSASTSEPTSPESSSTAEQEKDMTLAENYDFGDPSTWAAEKMVVTDLGDFIIDAYPYDERYDWGQSVICDEEEGVYKMWWCRHSGYDSIWYAESEDLKHWTNAQKLLAPETNTTWIKLHVGKPSVLKLNGKYIMYFEAPATLNGWKEFDNNVFMATSDDGIKWSIWQGDADEPYPVIRMTDTQMQASWNQSQMAGGSGYGFYGIGQPSAVYKDGTYYLYCTYSLEAGDRMYVFQSTDGIHFDQGQEVFTRAGSGIKYNTLTQKFMMTYEYSQGRMSRVYYMESDDGVKFTYSNYTEAANNQNILSTGGGFVRGYPDFIGNGSGHVNGHTVYVSYMEGKMADTGNDWRQYAHTWDIHFAAFNLAQYANRTMVLPNGHIKNSDTMLPYRDKHVEYEDKLEGISKTATVPVIDGERDEAYASSSVLKVDRVSCAERAVPGSTTAELRVTYTADALYILVEVKDQAKGGDKVYVLVDEKRFASNASEIFNVEAWRDKVKITDGNSEAIEGAEATVKETADGYNVEIKMPWRYKTGFEAYDSFGFDCYVYDNIESAEYKSLITWNDFNAGYNSQTAGELYFHNEN